MSTGDPRAKHPDDVYYSKNLGRFDVYQLPAEPKRMETGPIQFGDDWPGIFIRGDDAASYAHALEVILQLEGNDPIMGIYAKSLVELLRSSRV